MKNLCLKRGKWWYSKMTDGKRVWVNLQTSDEAVAIQRVGEIKDSPILKPSKSLLDDAQRFIDWKVRMNKYGRASSIAKLFTIKLFINWLPTTATLGNITAAQVSAFYTYLQGKTARFSERKLSETTIQGYMMTLRSFFGWAINQERVRLDNPVQAVHMATCDRRARQEWANKNLKNRLIENAPNDDLRFILFCGFDAGLRKNEIIEARRDWFDLKHGVLAIRKSEGDRLQEGELPFRPKNRHERVIPLTKPFQAFLKRYLKGLDPLDFPLQPMVKHAKYKYRYDFHRPFTEFMKAQKCAHITAHIMRHSFASILGNSKKVDALRISRYLGNGLKVAEGYIKIDPQDDCIHVLS